MNIFMGIIYKIEEYLIAILIAIMIIINFGNVISRYLLNASWSFSEEILLILFIWVVMLASATAFKRFEHLGLPILLDYVPRSFKKVLIIFSGIMSVLLVVAVIISGIYMVYNQVIFNQTTSVLSLPEWLAGISIPICSLFIILRIIQSTITQLSEIKEGVQK